MDSRQWAFFKDFLDKFWESLFLQNVISSARCDRLKALLGEPETEECARLLFLRRVVEIPTHHIVLRLKTLRELDGRSFDHIEVLFPRREKRGKTKCFVGHRFIPKVQDTLRWNLRQILEPYSVELDWSGRDIRSVQILEDIDRRIRAADFCVFDNRAAKGKPNVYIEAGMCFALRKPFILFEYEPPSKDREAPGPIPSDLGFALALRYRNYKQLFRDFYFRLPVFFEENLRRTRKR